jgi:NADH dehydrogenase FAD-containing subunit
MDTTLAPPNNHSTKTVAVLGASYGGTRAAQILAQNLPDGWRVVLVDRNRYASIIFCT